MNDNQKQRIDEFLNRIIDASLPAGQQVKVFAQDDNVETGDSGQSNGNCINKSVACIRSTNGICTNYNLYCGDTINQSECDEKLTDIDFDTHSCGN